MASGFDAAAVLGGGWWWRWWWWVVLLLQFIVRCASINAEHSIKTIVL